MKEKEDIPDYKSITQNDLQIFIKNHGRADTLHTHINAIHYLDPTNSRSKRILHWLILKNDEDYSLVALRRLLPNLTQGDMAQFMNQFSYDWHIQVEVTKFLNPKTEIGLKILNEIGLKILNEIILKRTMLPNIKRHAIERLCSSCINNDELLALADKYHASGFRSVVLGYLKYETEKDKDTVKKIFKDKEQDFVIRKKMLQFFKHELSDSELIYIAKTDYQTQIRIQAIKAIKNKTEQTRNFLLEFITQHHGQELGTIAKKKFKHLVGYDAE